MKEAFNLESWEYLEKRDVEGKFKRLRALVSEKLTKFKQIAVLVFTHF